MAIDATTNTEQSAADAAAAEALTASSEPAAGEQVAEGTALPDQPSEADVAYARSQGWVEKEKYRGAESDWIDAGTFSKRAREINPIINARNRDLAAQNKQLQEQIDQVRRDAGEAIAGARAIAQREYTAKLADLKAQRATAINEGDGALVTQIEDAMGALQPPSEPKKVEPEAQYAPALASAAETFAARNPWYGEGGKGDPEKTGLAMAVARTLLRERPDLKGNPEFFTELEYQLKADHPDLFRAKATPKLVDAGGRPAQNGSKVKKTIADLPKDAQDTAKRYVRNGWLASEQEYVDQYLAVEQQAKEA
jgi:hypothetical protein